MPRRPRTPPLELIAQAQVLELKVQPSLTNAGSQAQAEEVPLPLRVQQLIELLSSPIPKKAEEMYCFIMYDIEDNKVRRLVAKYLEKKGCIRVQKSVFFAKLHRAMYSDVTQTLKAIQEAYQNNDSILALPVGEDMLNSLLVIGKEFEYEMIQQQRSTLFF